MTAIISVPEAFIPIIATIIGHAVFGLALNPVQKCLQRARNPSIVGGGIVLLGISVRSSSTSVSSIKVLIFRNWERTLAWSVFTASYCIVPLALNNSITLESIKDVVVRKSRYLQDEDSILFAWNAMLLNWIGSYVIPLDWNRPWQKWPIPNAFCGSLSLITYQVSNAYIQYARRQEEHDTKKKKA